MEQDCILKIPPSILISRWSFKINIKNLKAKFINIKFIQIPRWNFQLEMLSVQPQECDNVHFDKISAARRYGKLLRSEGVSRNFGQPKIKMTKFYDTLRTSKS